MMRTTLVATEAGERMTRVQVGDFLRMSVARREKCSE